LEKYLCYEAHLVLVCRGRTCSEEKLSTLSITLVNAFEVGGKFWKSENLQDPFLKFYKDTGESIFLCHDN
jgi:hypothetical protein